MKIRCGVCGNIFDEKNKNKKVSDLECPKCKSDKISIIKKESKIKQFFKNKVMKFIDNTTGILGRVLAALIFPLIRMTQYLIFTYERDISTLIICLILLTIMTFVKLKLFIDVPLYIIGLLIISTFVSVRFGRR